MLAALRRLTPILAAAALALAGCSGGGNEAQPPATTTTPSLTPEQTQESDVAVQRSRVLKTFGAFLTAAGKHDAAGMWAQLSQPSQARLGLTLAEFTKTHAKTLEANPGQLSKSQGDLLVAEPLSASFAVIAIGGKAAPSTPYTVFAAALRREGDAWKVELGASVHLTDLRPRANESLSGSQHQIAAGIVSDTAPVHDSALWLDGSAVPGQVGGTDKRHVTVFGTLQGEVPPGRHTVVVFARAGHDAAAFAWTYRLTK